MVPQRSQNEKMRRIAKSMVRVTCLVQLKDGKRFMDLMLMLALNDTMDHFSMADSVPWYDHMLKIEDFHVLRMTLDSEVEVKGRKGI